MQRPKETRPHPDEHLEVRLGHVLMLQKKIFERSRHESNSQIITNLATQLETNGAKLVGVVEINGANDLSFFNLKGATTNLIVLGISDDAFDKSTLTKNYDQAIKEYEISERTIRAVFAAQGNILSNIRGQFGYDDFVPIVNFTNMAIQTFRNVDQGFKPTDIVNVSINIVNEYGVLCSATRNRP